MVFIDDLGVIEVLLLLAATVLAYAGLRVWWAMRRNKPEELRSVLKGAAVPIGILGGVSTTVALWGEIAWPFPSFMAGYNIFFFDALLLFGLVLMICAVCAVTSTKLQYAGLFALVAGGALMFYGWTAYTASAAFTKDPLDTFLMYAAFGAAGIFAFPATIIVDYYLGAVDALQTPWLTGKASPSKAVLRGLGSRGAQPFVPATGAKAANPEMMATPEPHFSMPIWVQTLLLLFPVFMALAGIAALWYFGTTLPGHLGGGPGAAP